MKKLLIIVLLLAALTSVAFASPQQTPQDLCLLRLTPYMDIVRDAGLRPSVLLAQAAIETGWCRSDAVRWNNYWGIKCMGYGTCFAKSTWEIYDGKYWSGMKLFQAFDSASEGIQAYCRKILYQKEYQDMDYTDLNTYIETLAKVWATDPDYAKKLKVIIKRYGLIKYDRSEVP